MTEHDPLVRARLKSAIDDARIDVDDGWDTLHAYRSVEPHRTLTVAVALAIAIAGLAFGGWVFTRNDTRPGSGGQPDSVLFERYTQDTEAPTEIWSVALDGTNAHALPQPPGSNTNPVWSPDGSKIAFVNQKGSDASTLWVMNGDGTEAMQLLNGFGVDQPAWSPDGTDIAFVGTRDPSAGSAPETGIYIVPAAGGQPKLVLPGLYWQQPDWSPDGSRLALIGSEAGNDTFDVYLVRPDGSDLTRLTSDGWNYASPAWSPDGTKIALSRSFKDGKPDVYVMDVDGTDFHQLTKLPGWDSSPTWSDDGSRIMYASEGPVRTGMGAADLAIYVMHSDGSDSRLIFDASTQIANPTSWLS
jgi:Tol biopolymer transport system component